MPIHLNIALDDSIQIISEQKRDLEEIACFKKLKCTLAFFRWFSVNNR